MPNKESTTKDIMTVVTGVKENTEEILEAIGIFSNKVEERFDKIDARFNKMDGRMDKLERHLGALDSSVKNYLELSDKRYFGAAPN